MTSVYFAARYSRREELLQYAQELEKRGVTVTSRWLKGDHQATDDDLECDLQWSASLAKDDLEDVERANMLIEFSEEPRSVKTRGGRHVEMGYALALTKQDPYPGWMRYRVIVVGPRENVFDTLPSVVWYETWEDCLAKEFPVMVRL